MSVRYSIDRLREFGESPVSVVTPHGTFEGVFDTSELASGAVVVQLFPLDGDGDADRDGAVVLLLDDIEHVAPR